MPEDIRRVTGSAPQPGLLARIAGALITLGALAIGLMFSVVLFVVALVAGATFFGWLWWKTRSLRKLAAQMPPLQPGGFNQPPGSDAQPRTGEVIEGEVIRSEWEEPRG